MGLLDSLSDPNGADPGAGLLSFLASLQRNAPASQTGPLPSDVAQYGAPSAPAPVFAGSTSPPQSSPVPQQPPAVIPAPQPAQPITPAASAPAAALGIGSNLMAGYENLRHGGGLIGSVVAALTGQRNDPYGVQLQQQAQMQNVTFKALTAKGIDPQVAAAAVAPGNTEFLKTLITQTFGPQTIENLGSGYIRDPRTGKITRAYTPDDKTPAGFAQDDNGTMHFVPGGPADPAYLRLKAAQAADPNAVHVLGKGGELYKVDVTGNPTIVHKNESNEDATLDDPTTKAMAAQYLAGDRTVMQNLGRGAQGAANIVKLRTEIYKQAQAQGLDGKGIVDNFNEQAGALAGQRTVGTRAANISLAANEANNMIPIAIEASKAVPRGQYVPINKAVQMIQAGSSSPELARFVAATNSLVNAYVRAVSPSGVPTDSMREHAYHMLNSAQSHDAYVAVTKIMQDEMKAALTAPGQVQKELRRSGNKSPESETKAPVKIDGYTITEH